MLPSFRVVGNHPPPPPILGERASGVCIPKRRKKRGKCAFAPSPIWQNSYFIQLTTSGNSFRCSSLVVQLTVFALSPSEEHFFAKKCSDKGAKTYKIVMFCLIVFGITIRYAHKCAFAHARQLRLSARASYAAFGGVFVRCALFFLRRSLPLKRKKKTQPPLSVPPKGGKRGGTEIWENSLLTNRKKRCIIATC